MLRVTFVNGLAVSVFGTVLTSAAEYVDVSLDEVKSGIDGTSVSLELEVRQLKMLLDRGNVTAAIDSTSITAANLASLVTAAVVAAMYEQTSCPSIILKTCMISKAADLVGIPADTLTKSIGGVMPVGARLVGTCVEVPTGFDDDIQSDFSITVGTAEDPDWLREITGVSAADVATISKFGNRGVGALTMEDISGMQFAVTLTAKAALATTVVGALTVNIAYVIM